MPTEMEERVPNHTKKEKTNMMVSCTSDTNHTHYPVNSSLEGFTKETKLTCKFNYNNSYTSNIFNFGYPLSSIQPNSIENKSNAKGSLKKKLILNLGHLPSQAYPSPWVSF